MSNWPFDENTVNEVEHLFDERRKIDKQAADTFWNTLSYEDKCNAFHAVTERIFEGEIKENRTYRSILYNVFGFSTEMYTRAIDCGYMAIHNSIRQPE